eukprot:gene12783-15111_t
MEHATHKLEAVVERIHWYTKSLASSVRQLALTTPAVPYNLKRCWGLRRVPKSKSESQSQIKHFGLGAGGLNDPGQTNPLQTALMVIVGVGLAFLVLSSVSGKPNHGRSFTSDLRVVLSHPGCFLRGGRTAAIVCAARAKSERQREKEDIYQQLHLRVNEDEVAAESNVADIRIQNQTSPQVPEDRSGDKNCSDIEEELWSRVQTLETGLLKNAEELEQKDKELMEAHLALKAQEMVVTQLQSTLANLFGQQSSSNTTVAGELNSLLTIASQLLVVANQTAAGV